MLIDVVVVLTTGRAGKSDAVVWSASGSSVLMSVLECTSESLDLEELEELEELGGLEELEELRGLEELEELEEEVV